jgi:hypothetical protein
MSEHFDDECFQAAALDVHMWPSTPMPGEQLDVAHESSFTNWQQHLCKAMMAAPPSFMDTHGPWPRMFVPLPPSQMAWVPDAAAVPPPPLKYVAESNLSAPHLVLQLAEAIPQLGSPELPTIGSAGHSGGTCKPCAFLHKQGCSNGIACSFCHRCDAGEKRKRQKDKKAQLKAMRETIEAGSQ